MKGLFITFEGPEGAGKSTQVNKLKELLEAKGHNVLLTREPGGTVIGEEIRHLVKHVVGKDAVCDEAELLLFSASRAQLVRKVIKPHLENGGVVICDRFADSTTAYQGYGRGWSVDVINQMHQIAVCNTWPDITFLLDVKLDCGVSRRKHREALGDSLEDRLEAEEISFHQRVRDGFLAIAKDNPSRVKIIDGGANIEAVTAQIISVFNESDFAAWI